MPELWYIKHERAPRRLFTTMDEAREYARQLDGLATVCRVPNATLLQNFVRPSDVTITA